MSPKNTTKSLLNKSFFQFQTLLSNLMSNLIHFEPCKPKNRPKYFWIILGSYCTVVHTLRFISNVYKQRFFTLVDFFENLSNNYSFSTSVQATNYGKCNIFCKFLFVTQQSEAVSCSNYMILVISLFVFRCFLFQIIIGRIFRGYFIV